MNFFEGDNIGSLAKLEITLHSNFDNFNPAVLSAGKTWLNIPFKEQTGSLQIETADTENGNVYTYTGDFFINRLRPELAELNAYLGQFVVMRITDLNGEVYIIGAPGMPVTLTLAGGTGKKYTSENGASYIFVIEQAFPHYTA